MHVDTKVSAILLSNGFASCNSGLITTAKLDRMRLGIGDYAQRSSRRSCVTAPVGFGSVLVLKLPLLGSLTNPDKIEPFGRQERGGCCGDYCCAGDN
jgi:hypothetical protein